MVNQLKAGVILSYASMMVNSLISILYTPIMLRLMGRSEYGLYSLVASIVGYLGILNFGFGSAFIKYYSLYKVNGEQEDIDKLNGMFMMVYSVIGLIALIVGLVLTFSFKYIFEGGLSTTELQKAKILMLIMSVDVAISFPGSVFDANITSNERFFFQRILNLIKNILNPLLILPILLLGYRSIALVTVRAVINVACIAINVQYCFTKLKVKFVFGKFDTALLKEIWVFSFYIFLNMIADQINWNVDRFILGVYKGTVGVAIYAVGTSFNTYYLTFSSSISSVFIPKINRLISGREENSVLTDLFTRVGRIQFVVLSFILSSFIIFGQYFIKLWAGEGYATSYYVALWLMIPVTVPLIQNLGIEMQKAKNLHKFRSILYIGIAVCNAAISIPLCKMYGVIGPAMGTAFALIIGNGIVMNIYYHIKVGINIKFFWKEITKLVPAATIPFLIGLAVKHTVGINGVEIFIVFAFLYSVTFVASMWFVGLNTYEKNLFLGPVKGLLRIKQ